MYEPALRVPLLVRYPRLARAGYVERRPVLNVDIAPTLLDFAGIRVPEVMQGRSMRPLLEGNPPPDWRESILYSYYENSWAFRGMAREQMTDPGFQYWTAHRVGPHRGVRTDRYKLIEYYGEGDYWELFDLEDDPDELRNLYEEPGHGQLIEELRADLNRLRERYGERG
jgi:arylsulfatase A-like enzyme